MGFKKPFRAVPIRPGTKYMRSREDRAPTSVAFKRPFVAVPVKPSPSYIATQAAETAVKTEPVQIEAVEVEKPLELPDAHQPVPKTPRAMPARSGLRRRSSWGPVQLLLLALAVSVGSLIGIGAADWLQ